MEFLGSPKLRTDTVALSLYNKRFVAVAKMVDLLIEPLAHADGHDLLKDGFNLSTANLLHICMPVFFGNDDVNRLLAAFIAMFRVRTAESISDFYGIAGNLFRNHSHRAVATPFAPIVASERLIGEILAHNDKLALDPAIPAFFQHCALWGERLDGSFKVLHDESKPIFQDKEALETLMAPEEEPQRIGYDRRTFLFPLRAKGISFASSENDPRLQVADLLASGAASWAASTIDSARRTPFSEDLANAEIDRFLVDSVWPSSAITPAELGTDVAGGVDYLAHMTDFLARRRK